MKTRVVVRATLVAVVLALAVAGIAAACHWESRDYTECREYDLWKVYEERWVGPDGPEPWVKTGEDLLEENSPTCGYTPPQPEEPVDVCVNIGGVQPTLPSGYHFEGEDICVEDGWVDPHLGFGNFPNQENIAFPWDGTIFSARASTNDSPENGNLGDSGTYDQAGSTTCVIHIEQGSQVNTYYRPCWQIAYGDAYSGRYAHIGWFAVSDSNPNQLWFIPSQQFNDDIENGWLGCTLPVGSNKDCGAYELDIEGMYVVYESDEPIPLPEGDIFYHPFQAPEQQAEMDTNEAAALTDANDALGVPEAATVGAPSAHTVLADEYLSGIAEQYGIEYAELLQANPQIIDPNIIHPGDIVNIPLVEAN